jgi:glycosyltransferase involved in cell wall biosynthesis
MPRHKKIKVLMLTSSYPIEGSNLGPFVQNIVKGLVKKGIEVGVMVFSASKKYKEYKKDGAIIYEYPYTKVFNPLLHKNRGIIPSVKASFLAKLQLFSYFSSTMRYLKNIAKDYDIIHAHWYLPAGIIACLAKNSIKKPVITTAWGAEFHLQNNFLVRKALNYVNKRSNNLVAVSKYMRERAKAYHLDVKNMEVIPNSTDIAKFSLKRKKTNKVIIGTARRLVPEKRVQDLINAFSKLDSNSELWIIGDGPEMKSLKELSKKLGTDKKTKFFGMVQHDKIAKLFSMIGIYVNPSIQEGMATANIEAMASGCAVIATKGYGNDEIISDKEDGLLYEGKNASELASLLRRLVNDANLRNRLAKKAREKAKLFSIEKIAEKYLENYSEILGVLNRKSQ